MPMQSTAAIGSDSAKSPFPQDFIKYMEEPLVREYLLQPSVAVKLAGSRIQPEEFDGKAQAQIATILEPPAPGYDLYPKEKDTDVLADTISVTMPQIYYTVALQEDQMKLTLAGRNRPEVLFGVLLEKVREKEDIISFQGDSGTGVTGLADTNGSSYDLGDPTGAWDTDSGSNGVLNYAKADLEKLLDYFTNAGVPATLPVDLVLTSYAYNLLKNTHLVRTPSVSNLDLWRQKLNGGEIYMTNNLQASATANANTMLGVVRTPVAFTILRTGLEQKMDPMAQLWTRRYGIREKFSIKVFHPRTGNSAKSFYCAFMDTIDTTT